MPHGETACFVRIVFPLKDGLLLPKRKSVNMGRENLESRRKNAKASFRSLWGELTVFLCVRVQAQSQLHLYRQIINKKHKYVNRAARNNCDFCVGLMIQTCF